ncbi:hypothetical protein CU103_25500 [Phyllobacterium sophorae]|uniref:Uncharacterized protein n=2 Tax=Phyllobacterium sophorae TaxID=1520277 RepID=A0A2P7B396_9HYPH|nr:hypothetical protein CU103_25500 [Phyllobacterium sophorae]
MEKEMDKSELLARLKVRRSIAITAMLKSGENDKSLVALSAIQGSISAIEAHMAEKAEPAGSPWNDPHFKLA